MGGFLVAAVLAATLGECVPNKEIILLATDADLTQIRACPCCDFRMTANITVPPTHIPIEGFTGSLDGDGYSLYISSVEIGNDFGNFGFFRSIVGGQVFNLNVVPGPRIAIPGTIQNFGFLAGYASDPYLYNISLISDSGAPIEIVVDDTPSAGGKHPVAIGGLIGDVLLEGYTLTYIFSSVKLTVTVNAMSPMIIGSIFGSIGGTQRVSSMRVNTGSALTVVALNVPLLTVGGAIGSAQGTRIVTTSAALGDALSVWVGPSTNATVGGFVGVASHLSLINTSWGEIKCYGNKWSVSTDSCTIGGVVGILRSTADDTRISTELVTHSFGYVKCYDIKRCHVGGVIGGMEDSDLASVRNFMNIVVYGVESCQTGGVIGYMNGGRLNMVSSACTVIDVNANRTVNSTPENYFTVAGGVVGSIERLKSSTYSEISQSYARIKNFTVQGNGMIISGGFAGRIVTFVTYLKDTRYEADIDIGADIRKCGAAISNYTVRSGHTTTGKPLNLYLSVGGFAGDVKMGRISSCYYYSTEFSVYTAKNAIFVGGITAVAYTSTIEGSLANIGTFKIINNQAADDLFSFIGGITGSLTNRSTVRDSYANINSTSLSSTTTFYYGGVIGSLRSSSVSTTFGISKDVTITRSKSSKARAYVGGFTGGTRQNSEVEASWVKTKITIDDQTNGEKDLMIGGFVGSVGGTHIKQSYSEAELILNRENRNCGRYIGYLYSNTNLSQNLALTKIVLNGDSNNVYTPRGFCGNASQYYISKGKQYDNVLQIAGCIAYKTDSETPDDSSMTAQDNSSTIPTSENYTKGVSYGTNKQLKEKATYKGWSKITQTPTKTGRYNLTDGFLPLLTQLPNLKRTRTLFGSDYVLEDTTCTYPYSCWFNGTECHWKMSSAKVYNTLPIFRGSLLNECRGLSTCKTNAPGMVTCDKNMLSVTEDFTCTRCNADAACNSFSADSPSTCDKSTNTCTCGLGTAGPTCEITFCQSIGRKCNNPKVGTCQDISGISRCVCAQGFYAVENQCVERHSNWNRIPYAQNGSNKSRDISSTAMIILLIFFLVVASLAVYFGLAFYGKAPLPCRSTKHRPKPSMSGSTSYVHMPDDNKSFSIL